MQNELQTALFQAFDTLNLQRVKTFSVLRRCVLVDAFRIV